MNIIEWQASNNLVAYPDAIKLMEARVADIILGKKQELVWCLEHPALYTAGISANAQDLLANSNELPIYQSGRGGKYTYHGPGQRVVYLMLNLKQHSSNQQPDLHLYVRNLEQVIIEVLECFNITGFARAGRTGIWVKDRGYEKKIAAIGIRVRKWISYHGIAININPNMQNFQGIVPCGIKEFGVTSLKELGIDTTMIQVDKYIKQAIAKVFAVEIS